MECRRSLLLSLPLMVFACAIHLSEHEATNMLQVEQSGGELSRGTQLAELGGALSSRQTEAAGNGKPRPKATKPATSVACPNCQHSFACCVKCGRSAPLCNNKYYDQPHRRRAAKRKGSKVTTAAPTRKPTKPPTKPPIPSFKEWKKNKAKKKNEDKAKKKENADKAKAKKKAAKDKKNAPKKENADKAKAKKKAAKVKKNAPKKEKADKAEAKKKAAKQKKKENGDKTKARKKAKKKKELTTMAQLTKMTQAQLTKTAQAGGRR